MDVHSKTPVISGAGAPRSWNDRYKLQSLHADSAPALVRDPKAVKSDKAIEDQARKWVAQTFFGTLLKQMRDSPFKSELFSGGRGEQAFGPVMDAHMAERMARGSGNKLVKSIVKRFKTNRDQEARDAYETHNLNSHKSDRLKAPPKKVVVPGKESPLATTDFRA